MVDAMSSSRGSDKARVAAQQALSTTRVHPAAWIRRLDWLSQIVTDGLGRPHGGRAMGADELAAQLSTALPELGDETGIAAFEPISCVGIDLVADTVMTRLGPCATADLCRMVCAVHAVAALNTDVPPTNPVLREGVRGLAAALEQAHPGRSIEVRVPPVIAVQLAAASDGPTHRRGTPPNVVETDPGTFVQMATGLVGWATAVTGGLSHSGAHADEVADFLPVLDLR